MVSHFILGSNLNILGLGPKRALWGSIWTLWGPLWAPGAQYRYRHWPIEFLAKLWMGKWYDTLLYDQNSMFRFGPHMGPLGAYMGPLGAPMGPWGTGIGIDICPLNLWRNSEWKNGMTLYCKTKTEHFMFSGPIWALWGPIWGWNGLVDAIPKKVCNISVAQMVWHQQAISIW